MTEIQIEDNEEEKEGSWRRPVAVEMCSLAARRTAPPMESQQERAARATAH